MRQQKYEDVMEADEKAVLQMEERGDEAGGGGGEGRTVIQMDGARKKARA